jgi:hypothetical protein
MEPPHCSIRPVSQSPAAHDARRFQLGFLRSTPRASWSGWPGACYGIRHQMANDISSSSFDAWNPFVRVEACATVMPSMQAVLQAGLTCLSAACFASLGLAL